MTRVGGVCGDSSRCVTGRVLQPHVGDKAARGHGAGGHSGGTWGHLGVLHKEGPAQLGTGTRHSPKRLRGGAPAPCIALLPDTAAARHKYIFFLTPQCFPGALPASRAAPLPPLCRRGTISASRVNPLVRSGGCDGVCVS